MLPHDLPAPPSAAAAESADAAAIVAGYPGAALLVSDRDEVLAANALAESLLAGDRGWWASLALWRTAAFSGLAAFQSTPLERPAGPAVYEWSAIPLDGARLLLLGRDATLERQLRSTLTESRQRYKDLVEVSSDFAWETGADGRFVFVSPGGALGLPAERLVGHHPSELTIEATADLPAPFETRRPVDRAELWLRGADGAPVYVQTSAKPLFACDGTWIGARGVCRDLTAQVLQNAELARTRNRERVLDHIVHTLRDQFDASKALEVAAHETTRALEATGCAIHRISDDGSSTLAANFGLPLDGHLSGLIRQAAQSEEPLEHRMGPLSLLVCRTRFRQTVNGTVSVWRPRDTEPWDDDARALISGVADRIGITHAQLAYQEHLRHLSERDSLTGLFNRRTFLERLEEMLNWRDFGTSALLYLDLDNFKAVNDLRGHHQGDEVLRAVAGLIGSDIRPGDIAGRMGGDEFVLWLARTGEHGAITVARRLLAAVAALRALSASKDKPLGISIGIAVHQPHEGEGVAALIERADTAMYQAKTHGKGSFSLAPPHRPAPAAAQPEEPAP
ncbi:MAG: diguanylate cyclase [Rhodospirillaceae bacterium]